MKTLRNIIIFIIILCVIGVLLYFIFYKNDSKIKPETSLQTTSVVDTKQDATDQTKALSQKFIESLSKIKNINLATSFFDTVVYKSLQDYTQVIVLQDPSLIGRPNPFAPFDTDFTNTATDTTVNVAPSANTVVPSSNPPASVDVNVKNTKKKQ